MAVLHRWLSSGGLGSQIQFLAAPAQGVLCVQAQAALSSCFRDSLQCRGSLKIKELFKSSLDVTGEIPLLSSRLFKQMPLYINT